MLYSVLSVRSDGSYIRSDFRSQKSVIDYLKTNRNLKFIRCNVTYREETYRNCVIVHLPDTEFGSLNKYLISLGYPVVNEREKLSDFLPFPEVYDNE